MPYEFCSLNVAPRDYAGVIACENPATVKVREQRSPHAAKVLGRDYTIHEVCRECAAVLTRNPKFTVTQ